MNPFSHIDLRVVDIDAAAEFYGRLLPALGFTLRFEGPVWKVFVTEAELPAAAFFSIVEDRSHQPNANASLSGVRVPMKWTASARC